MADQEMRKGIRLLVSGGMAGLGSDTIQRLRKSCEFEQRQRSLSILTEKEAEYLANYVEVCDGGRHEIGMARTCPIRTEWRVLG